MTKPWFFLLFFSLYPTFLFSAAQTGEQKVINLQQFITDNVQDGYGFADKGVCGSYDVNCLVQNFPQLFELAQQVDKSLLILVNQLFQQFTVDFVGRKKSYSERELASLVGHLFDAFYNYKRVGSTLLPKPAFSSADKSLDKGPPPPTPPTSETKTLTGGGLSNMSDQDKKEFDKFLNGSRQAEEREQLLAPLKRNLKEILMACNSNFEHLEESPPLDTQKNIFKQVLKAKCDVDFFSAKDLLKGALNGAKALAQSLRGTYSATVAQDECEKGAQASIQLLNSHFPGTFGIYMTDILLNDPSYDDMILAMLDEVKKGTSKDAKGINVFAPMDLWKTAIKIANGDKVKAMRLITMTTFDPGPMEIAKVAALRLRQKGDLERVKKLGPYFENAELLRQRGSAEHDGKTFFNGIDIGKATPNPDGSFPDQEFTPHHFLAGAIMAFELNYHFHVPEKMAAYMAGSAGVAYETNQAGSDNYYKSRTLEEARGEFVRDTSSHFSGGIIGAFLGQDPTVSEGEQESKQQELMQNEQAIKDVLSHNFEAAKGTGELLRGNNSQGARDAIKGLTLSSIVTRVPLIND